MNKKNSIDVIVNGDLEEEPAPTGETSAPPAPKTAKQLAARRNQERVKSILLLAIPDEYLLKFHKVTDAKSLWEVIKSRFGGNEESKKMQKNVLKHQFENFSTASNESLDKAYDRFQKLISQLEVHGAPISKEAINQKFLRSLPPSWNQIALIMRNKPDIDEIDIYDFYNNFRVYEDEMKRSSSSNSASQNMAFLSSENTSSTNEVSTASGDFKIDEDDSEELDLRWQVAMLTVRCYNCHRKGHFARECRSGRNQGKRSYGDNGRSNAPINESSSQALVAQDGLGGYDWSNDFEIEPVNYALMAISSLSSSSLSNNEVRSSDEETTSANDRFSKADGYHVVPPPITGNFLTPRADISFAGLDEYAIRKKIIESKTTKINTDTSKSKTSETIDDEDNVSKVNTVSPVKTNVIQTVKTQVDKIGQTSQKEGIGFKKIKACFVCKSTDHLIKDCDFYAKKSPEPKLKTVANTGVLTRIGLVNPVRPNRKRAVHTISTARPISTASPISTARPFAPKIAQTGSAIRPIYPRMDNVRPRASYSPIKRSYYSKPAFRPKNLKQDVKTSFGVQNMTTAGTRAVVNTGKGMMDTDLKKS
ncbi:ribonuclease H-like domain-containing protein, partial [Tanacetum coccineum]